jgi:ABC-type spermidine/putrescine transport system permease subunit I
MLIGNLVQHEFLVVRDWPVGSAVSFVLMAAVAGGLWGLMQVKSNKYEVKSEK